MRYKQSVLSFLWALARPIALIVVFTYLVGTVAGMDSGDIPYPIFVFSGVLCFELFSSVVIRVGGSMVANKHLISRMNAPKLLFPISAIVVCLFDNALLFLCFIVFIQFFDFSITPSLILFPVFMLVNVVTGMMLGLIIASMSVWFRDFAYIVTYAMQILLLMSPVGYSSGRVPDAISFVNDLNPVSHIIEFYRATLLGIPTNHASLAVLSFEIIVLGAIGLTMFWYLKRWFADVI